MSFGSVLPSLTIKGKTLRFPIIQGGMGVGISLHPLTRAVARFGGLGLLSSACLDRLLSKRNGKRMNTYEATYEEVSLAKAEGGPAGINIIRGDAIDRPQEELRLLISDKRLAFNINTREELDAVKSFLGDR